LQGDFFAFTRTLVTLLPSMAFFFGFGLAFCCIEAGGFLPLPLCTDCSQNTYKKRI